MRGPDTELLVFAKAPIAGQAKTRLIPALGVEGAAELHARMVCHTLKHAVAAGLGTVTLWCAPDDTHAFFVECAQEFDIRLQVQHGNDLGQRMEHALAYSLSTSRQVMLLGTDCPSLDAKVLQNASQRLESDHSVLFVPAEDGGYVLIGVRGRAPRIFDGIAWGGNSVMAHTRNLLHQQSLDWDEMPPLHDIDTPQDLHLLRNSYPELLRGILDLEVIS